MQSFKFILLLDISFYHFSSNDNCSHFGPFAWPTHKGGRRHVGQRPGQIREDGSAADDGLTMRIVSCLSKDTHWARTPLMSPEHRDTNGHQSKSRTPIQSRQQSCSVTKLPSADKASCPCTSATGRRQLSWKFAPKMIYLELL